MTYDIPMNVRIKRNFEYVRHAAFLETSGQGIVWSDLVAPLSVDDVLDIK